MKFLFPLFAFVLIFNFSSCKKKELNFIIKGNIKSLNTKENVKDVKVKFYTSNLGNNVKDLIGETKTDVSGDYHIEIERTRFEKISIEINKEDYFELSKSYSIDELTTAKDNIFDYQISPKSWTKFVFKNNSPASESDKLKIQKVSGKTDCKECCENGFYYFNGLIDTTFICPNDGDTYMKFYYWVNDDEIHGLDSVFNKAFETVIYQLNY